MTRNFLTLQITALCNLESLSLAFGHIRPSHRDIISITRHLSLPTLRCLEFEATRAGVENAVPLLDHLTLPALDDLRITDTFMEADHESEMILCATASLSSRSSCQLRNLQLETVAFYSPNSAQIVSALSSVQNLTFRACWTDYDCRALHQALDNLRKPSLLPHLSTLHVGFQSVKDRNMKWLTEYIFPSILNIVSAWRTENHPQSRPIFTALQFDLLELEKGGLVLEGSAFGK